MVNPYGGQIYTVSLKQEDVTGFVFWTRNVAPFTDHLHEVARRGYPFYLQFTLTGYPRPLEPAVIAPKHAIEQIQMLCRTYGTRAVVWRYDPILFSSLTTVEKHRHTFTHFARTLAGQVDEVVISFAQIYRKSKRNLNYAATQHGFTWHDPPDGIKRELADELARIADSCGMKFSICAQRQFVAGQIRDARCIDLHRLSDIAGRELYAPAKPHRDACGCFAAKDIGAYDTCPQGCVYCYAVRNPQIAKTQLKTHNPESEILDR